MEGESHRTIGESLQVIEVREGILKVDKLSRGVLEVTMATNMQIQEIATLREVTMATGIWVVETRGPIKVMDLIGAIKAVCQFKVLNPAGVIGIVEVVTMVT
jgi:hypothetical protein